MERWCGGADEGVASHGLPVVILSQVADLVKEHDGHVRLRGVDRITDEVTVSGSYTKPGNGAGDVRMLARVEGDRDHLTAAQFTQSIAHARDLPSWRKTRRE
jgi:hypothetical protein